MTTIAYKDGVIAYDSRLTIDNFICDDDYNKKVEIENLCIFRAGCATEEDIEGFINCYHGDKEASTEIEAIVYDGLDLFSCGFCEESGFFKTKLDTAKHYAIGSGRDFAITAMDMGASSEQAITQAIKRDVYTGGNVKTFEVELCST